jgi:hypothetical protein
MPYGFPSGQELIREVVDFALHKPTPDIFNHAGFKNEDVQRLGNDLDQSDCPSIDTFLQYRPEFLGIGKLAIASKLAGLERDGKLDHRDYEPRRVPWYHYLWEQMIAGKGHFGENKVAFVTFNYDRSLERYFLRRLLHLHGYNNNEALEELYRIPFVHIHGSLGDEKFEEHPYDKPKHSDDEIVKISARLKLINEDDLAHHPNFPRAIELLHRARCICFLGYGFHELNNSGLQLDSIAEPQRRKTSRLWFASRYGMTNAEFRRKTGKCFGQFVNAMDKLNVGDENDTALETLRKLPIVE